MRVVQHAGRAARHEVDEEYRKKVESLPRTRLEAMLVEEAELRGAWEELATRELGTKGGRRALPGYFCDACGNTVGAHQVERSTLGSLGEVHARAEIMCRNGHGEVAMMHVPDLAEALPPLAAVREMEGRVREELVAADHLRWAAARIYSAAFAKEPEHEVRMVKGAPPPEGLPWSAVRAGAEGLRAVVEGDAEVEGVDYALACKSMEVLLDLGRRGKGQVVVSPLVCLAAAEALNPGEGLVIRDQAWGTL